MNDRDKTPKTPTNRPGLSQIAYRISDYNAFFRRLLDLLPEPDASGKTPLTKLTTRSTDDAAIALIDAWAMVADVLTFYQERIANEGYLRTATERRSLLELARAIGYELNPGVAASTYLSFTVEDAPDSPTVTKIPMGTQVMSVPEGEELPQNFETSEDFTAYLQWNAIKPRLTRPQKITPQTTQLYLSGTDTQLQAGDYLLLLDEENPDRIYLIKLTRVEANSQENHTLVKWEVPPLPAPLDTPLRQPQLFAFRQTASLFGSNAPEWETLSPEIKRTEIETYGGEIEGGVMKIVGQNNSDWQSNLVGKELPNLDISALINQGGDLFAAIPSRGVFRLIADSDRWVAINDGLTNFNIQSLYINDKGHIFAGGSNGTAGGGAFRSKDNGNSWTEIATGTIGVKPVSGTSNNEFEAVNTSISNTVVRAFLTYQNNGTFFIFVGTDNGVYRSDDGGKNWEQVNNISGNNGSLENTVIRSLVLSGKDLKEDREFSIYKKEQGEGKISIDNQNSTKIKGDNTTKFQENINPEDIIEVEGQFRIVKEITSDTEIKIDAPFSKKFEDSEFWIYKQKKGEGKISIDNQDRTKVKGNDTTKFQQNLNLGDIIEVEEQFRIVEQITNETELKVKSPFLSIFAGTDSGVFVSEITNITGSSPTWSEKSEGIDTADSADRDIQILISHNQNELYAGTANGKVYKFPQINNEEQWGKLSEEAIDSQKITALAINSEETILAGTESKGLYYFSDNNRWELIDPSPENIKIPKAITSLVVNQKEFFAGTKFAGFPQTEWSNFEVEDIPIQLDTLYPQILNNSLVVLVNGEHFEYRRVQSISTPLISGFNLSAQITQIEPNTPLREPNKFNRRSTNVLAQSEPLELAPEILTIAARGEQIFIDPIQQETFLEPIQQDFSQTKTIFLSQFIENLQSDQKIIISGKHIRTQIKDIGGIFRSPNQGGNLDPIKWESSNRGLTNSQVRSLVMNSQETELLAGTTQGIFRYLDNSKSWEPIDSWESIENKLENKAIQALLITKSNLIFVGTAEGLFRSEDNGGTWQQIKEDTGLIYSDILTLAVNDIDNNNTLLVGTINGGLFQSKDNGDRWTSVGLYNTDVQTIAIQKQLANNYYLFVGTTQKGIYRSIDKGNSWEQIIDTRPGRGRISSKDNQVTWVGSNFNQQIQAGFTINAAGQTRTVTSVLVPQNTVPENITEVTLSLDTPFRPDLVTQTPFTINTGLTNRSITAIAAGSRRIKETITINNNNTTITGKGFTSILKVGDTISIDLNGKIQTRTITQISENNLNEENKILTFDEPSVLEQQTEDQEPGEYIINEYIINKDLIFAGSSGSGVFRSQDNGDLWEQINVNLTDLEIRCLTVDLRGNVWVGTSTGGVFRSNNNGDFWIPFNDNLANIDVRAIVVSQANRENNKIFVGGIGILISPDGFESANVQLQDVLEVLKAPTPIQQNPLYQKWRVKDKDGFEGDLNTALPSQEFTLNHLTLLPAAEESGVVSEIATIATPPNDEQLPLLTLREPLKNSYDPETVEIYANVVQATHGQTVEEVLGSGDGNAINQSFALQEPPLTYVSAPTASGTESTLQVRVNGVLWQEVPALYPLKPQGQNYIIRIEDDGTTRVTFGDGVKGARLPTGSENITATYRQGIGTEGNVGAKSLSILNSTPPAIAEVINPLPATGGTAAETIKQVREKAPSTVRILDRIVSLQDFEDFARSFTGIGKAIATDLWSEQTQIVHITIASDTGESVPQESRLYTSLVEAIDAARDPLQQVVVDSYQPLPFDIAAKLLVNPRYQTEVVLEKGRSVLKNTFDFPERNFGQSVTAAEAIAVIQKVEGVTAVDLDALYQSVRSKALNQSLSASLARYDPITKQIRPAQMLLLNSAGIKLTIVPTL